MAGWPSEDLAARVAGGERFCLDWDLATRLENGKSAVWGGGVGGSKSDCSAIWKLREWRAESFYLNGPSTSTSASCQSPGFGSEDGVLETLFLEKSAEYMDRQRSPSVGLPMHPVYTRVSSYFTTQSRITICPVFSMKFPYGKK
ncbi:hypothetical protein AVEN_147677-1 [Araneus ventricosus]|uniref:Uncharacterized protein n=1 Tax=Araneus ventricosus TaxID=182803 RepID=A0A4Y2F3B5_ARAVE|nr:hypothetical protein AVEN_1310-1 [Araneus ventricosus]GBM36187.1 hypothetical protein AVEN_147677-1 [Araneus ventricosus]